MPYGPEPSTAESVVTNCLPFVLRDWLLPFVLNTVTSEFYTSWHALLRFQNSGMRGVTEHLTEDHCAQTTSVIREGKHRPNDFLSTYSRGPFPEALPASPLIAARKEGSTTAIEGRMR